MVHIHACRVERAIADRSLPQLAAELRSELAALSAADYSGHRLLSLKKQALVLDLLHYCRLAEELAEAPPGASRDWQWARQLRYYADTVRVPAGAEWCCLPV